MSYSCCSGNFSSRSFGGYLCYPSSSCGSSYPSNLVYCTDLCSPSACQLGFSLYSGCQDTRCEPTSCRTSCVVSSPCPTSCSRPRTSTLCSPCRSTYTGSLDCESLRSYCLGYGPRSSDSLGCGSRGFRAQGYGVSGFPSLSCGSTLCRPTYLASGSCQTSYCQPACPSGFYRQSTC
ncbi:keratin-associated protein 13-1-like [Crocuta crocuta]